jgi:hypothetical protein
MLRHSRSRGKDVVEIRGVYTPLWLIWFALHVFRENWVVIFLNLLSALCSNTLFVLLYRFRIFDELCGACKNIVHHTATHITNSVPDQHILIETSPAYIKLTSKDRMSLDVRGGYWNTIFRLILH